jgi:hypothetical protein
LEGEVLGVRSFRPGMYAISRMKAAQNAWSWQVSFRRRGKPYEKRSNRHLRRIQEWRRQNR